jgi:hypothetical protein
MRVAMFRQVKGSEAGVAKHVPTVYAPSQCKVLGTLRADTLLELGYTVILARAFRVQNPNTRRTQKVPALVTDSTGYILGTAIAQRDIIICTVSEEATACPGDTLQKILLANSRPVILKLLQDDIDDKVFR